jgi:hypothetical protein
VAWSAALSDWRVYQMEGIEIQSAVCATVILNMRITQHLRRPCRHLFCELNGPARAATRG